MDHTSPSLHLPTWLPGLLKNIVKISTVRLSDIIYILVTSFSIFSLRRLHKGERFRLVESHDLQDMIIVDIVFNENFINFVFY